MKGNMQKRIVVDADGVLLDYRASYPKVWLKAFGRELKVVTPNSYHAHVQYGLDIPNDEALTTTFFSHFDEEVWQTLPECPGAVLACQQLHKAGFELVCVTAMPPKFAKARLFNLRTLGFPIDQVIATGRVEGLNPKLAALTQLNPIAFVDDLGANFVDIPSTIHKGSVSVTY